MRGSTQTDTKLIFANLGGIKKGEKVHIKIVEADTKKNLPDVNDIGGMVTRIDTQVKTFKDETREDLRIWLRDEAEKETICLGVGLNSVGRSIVNMLATVEGQLGDLFIKVKTNKKGYPSVWITNNGEELKWKYSPAELKDYIKETTKRKIVDGKTIEVIEYDRLDLDQFLLGIWKNQIAKLPLAKSDPAKRPSKPKSEDSQEDHIPDNPATDDDLPF